MYGMVAFLNSRRFALKTSTLEGIPVVSGVEKGLLTQKNKWHHLSSVKWYPKGTVLVPLSKKALFSYTFSIQKQCQSGTKIVPFQGKGHCFPIKKVGNSALLQSGTILVPLGHHFQPFFVGKRCPFC